MNNTKNLRAVLLDIDGTLVDSNGAHADAWLEAFALEGIRPDTTSVRKAIGEGSEHLLKRFANTSPHSDLGKKIAASRQKIFADKYLKKLRPHDGARDLLTALHERELKLVVATSGSPEDQRSILEQCGLGAFFDAAANSGDVKNSKPDPDIVLAALERAGVSAEEAFMIGDTIYDIEAATAAGVEVVAFTSGGWTRDELKKARVVRDGPRDFLEHLDEDLNAIGKAVKTVELSESEEAEVEEHVSQRTPVIFEIIRREGNEELDRPLLSLVSSGITAGLSIGLSVLTQAFLLQALPPTSWAPLISKFGYCVGFLIVIMAHQQLFTENTLTAVVPLLAHFNRREIKRMLRLWFTVLSANIVGTFLFSLFVLHSGAFTDATLEILKTMSHDSVVLTWAQFLSRGVLAGFLVASLVWILANVETGKFAIIVMMTYLLALMDLAHIVAGSVEASLAFMSGVADVSQVGRFYLFTALGNVIGGSALFSILSYAQIHAEISD